MKFSSARNDSPSRAALLAALLLAATLGLAGCEGDNGSSGGTSGGGTVIVPPGPTGPTDVPISQGGNVANFGTGSALTAQQIADIGALAASIDAAAVTANKTVIDITVKTAKGGAVLGLAPTTLRLSIAKLVPATNGVASRWQNYINRSVAPSITTPALASAIQANTESGVAAGWSELGAGKYRYTSAVDLSTVTTPLAVAFEPALTHRVSIAIDLSGTLGQRALAPENPFKDFVPNGTAVTTTKLLAATKNCAGCHVQFAEHGGPRRSVEYCATCHNASTIDPDSGESVDLAYMAHSIHRGENRANPYVVYGFNGAKFDAGDITYPQPASFCETCHTKATATPDGDDWQTHPGAAACGGCHDAGLAKTGPSATTGLYTYTYTHLPTNPLLPNYLATDGTCNGCHRDDGAAGGILAAHKKDNARKVIENGALFTYKILKVENAVAGQAPKVTFQILDAAGAPLDIKAITTGRLRLDFAWTGNDIHNVADIGGDLLAGARGQAVVANFDTSKDAIVANGDGTFSYTLAQVLPAGFTDATLGTGLMVVLEGRRVMPDGSNAYPDSAFAFAGGPAREKLVDQAKCETCHKKLALHGGSRAGDPMICTVCHNSSVGGTFGTSVFGPLALGAFIHNVHASNVPALGAVTYPQSLARCEGCHVTGKFNAARASALPITVEAGTTLTTGAVTQAWKDDLADSATAGTCKGCHTSTDAVAHMTQQGGSFGVAKTLSPSSAVEGCPVCHGAGQSFDTVTEHCGKLPYGQCTATP